MPPHVLPCDWTATVSQSSENNFDTLRRWNGKYNCEAWKGSARKQSTSYCLSFSSDKRECNQNNSIIRLASTCDPTAADLHRQRICQLPLQRHCECHNALSGNKQRWWNTTWCNTRCNRNSAERDSVRACKAEIRSPDTLCGCVGDAVLYCTEALPDASTVAFEDAIILHLGTELAKLGIPFAFRLEQAANCCYWEYLKESMWYTHTWDHSADLPNTSLLPWKLPLRNMYISFKSTQSLAMCPSLATYSNFPFDKKLIQLSVRV